MPLTDSQKAQVRRYLGYSDINRSCHWELESAFDALSTEGQALVVSILEDIEGIDTELTAQRSKMGVVRVEDVWFSASDGVMGLRSERQRLVQDLANVFGLQPRTGGSSGRVYKG